MNDNEKHTMTKDERSLLEMLDKIVRSEKVRAQILPMVERVRTQLARKPNALMAWEPIALETFGALPLAIRSGWVFILRAGSDHGSRASSQQSPTHDVVRRHGRSQNRCEVCGERSPNGI